MFVDATGRRRKRIRVAFYCAGGASVVYAALVGVSIAGGPIGPEHLLPFADTAARPTATQSESTDVVPDIDAAQRSTAAPGRSAAGRTTPPPAGPIPPTPGTTPTQTTGVLGGVTEAPTTPPAPTTEPVPTPSPTPSPTPEPTIPIIGGLVQGLLGR